MVAIREATGLGASTLGSRPLKLHDIDGRRIGFVSYNGRVWLEDIEGNIEIPTT